MRIIALYMRANVNLFVPTLIMGYTCIHVPKALMAPFVILNWYLPVFFLELFDSGYICNFLRALS